jgi:hypothetical protein
MHCQAQRLSVKLLLLLLPVLLLSPQQRSKRHQGWGC